MKVAVFALVVVACASQQPAPPVTIEQITSVATYQVGIPGGVPVDYEVKVTNVFDHPITLKSLEIETVGGSGAYAMNRVRHAFNLTIAPHSVSAVPIRAWVDRLQQTDRGDVNAPATVRGVARFDSPSGVLRTAFASRVQ